MSNVDGKYYEVLLLGCLENTFEKFLIDYHGASQTVVSFVLGVAA